MWILRAMDEGSVALCSFADYENREHEGILVVPHAGEVLHRLRGKAPV